MNAAAAAFAVTDEYGRIQPAGAVAADAQGNFSFTVQLEAARAWSAWEGKTLSLLPDAERVRRFSEDHYALAFARIECHYFMHGGFFDADDQLIRAAHRLRDIQGVIVHGRYDVVTPAMIAVDLARAWPEADLRIVADAGHAMTEAGIVHELVTATNRFAW